MENHLCETYRKYKNLLNKTEGEIPCGIFLFFFQNNRIVLCCIDFKNYFETVDWMSLGVGIVSLWDVENNAVRILSATLRAAGFEVIEVILRVGFQCTGPCQ